MDAQYYYWTQVDGHRSIASAYAVERDNLAPVEPITNEQVIAYLNGH